MASWYNRRRRIVAPENVPRIAAVQAVGTQWHNVQSRVRQPWQRRAEFFGENLGLLRFAHSLISQSGARCVLRSERLVDPIRGEWEPVDERVDGYAAQVLQEYKGRDADTAGELVARHIWHYQSTGEAMMVVEATDRGLMWSVRSPICMEFRQQGVLVKDLPGGSERDGTARMLPLENVRRMWVPHPDWPLLATAPTKAILSDCERYWALARRIRREAESLLAGGLLFTPGYAHQVARNLDPSQPDSGLSEFDRDYYRIAEQAFQDDDSVAAAAALSVHYDGKDSNRDPVPPQFIYPGKMLDPNGIAYRTEAVEAIGRGLDLPMRLVSTGPGEGNHWSDWALQENAFSSCVAPTMDRVTHADMTAAFYRPTLRQAAQMGLWNGNPDLYRVGYDPSPVIVHPDRATSSIALYGQGLLAGAVVAEANGFGASDMPSPEELARIVETLGAIRGIKNAQPGEALDGLPAGPGTVKALPPARELAMASLAPYPGELTSWLD